jgi:hypothetical protein
MTVIDRAVMLGTGSSVRASLCFSWAAHRSLAAWLSKR